MTKSEILSLIATKTKQRNDLLPEKGRLEREIAALKPVLENWKSAWYGIRPSSKRKGSEAERKMYYYSGEINKRGATLNGIVSEIRAIDVEISSLNSSLQASNDAEKELSKQGTSMSALEIEAMGKASAEQLVGQARAVAVVDDSKSKKTRNIIIWSFVALLLVILLIWAYKKFIKKSK